MDGKQVRTKFQIRGGVLGVRIRKCDKVAAAVGDTGFQSMDFPGPGFRQKNRMKALFISQMVFYELGGAIR
jgi:hypothetical protein